MSNMNRTIKGKRPSFLDHDDDDDDDDDDDEEDNEEEEPENEKQIKKRKARPGRNTKEDSNSESASETEDRRSSSSGNKKQKVSKKSRSQQQAAPTQQKQDPTSNNKRTNKKSKLSYAKGISASALIDDAAVLSGSDEDDEDEEEDEDMDDNEYKRDGFVVGEEELEEEEARLRARREKQRHELEDSEDDEEDEDEDEEEEEEEEDESVLKHGDKNKKRKESESKRKRGRIRKLKNVNLLDEEDLALIQEAKGGAVAIDEDDPYFTKKAIPLSKSALTAATANSIAASNMASTVTDSQIQQQRQKTIKARSEAELRKVLFYDSQDDEGPSTGDKHRQEQGRKGPGLSDKKELPSSKDALTTNSRKKLTSKRFNASSRATTFDEDGLDDFIDYGENEDEQLDAEERQAIMAQRRQAHLSELNEDEPYYHSSSGISRPGISEAQLNEASDIFGSEYLDFMGGISGAAEEDDDMDRDYLDEEYADEELERSDHEDYAKKKQRRKRRSKGFRERGVGVDYGLDSSEEEKEEEDDIDSDDDEKELFGDDYDDDDPDKQVDRQQRAEALRLKREKRALEKAERRRMAALKTAERRKARLRRAFEPVQLVENFCTDRDDQIRMKDEPERFYDWNTPFHGPAAPQGTTFFSALADSISEEEEEEALWIMGKIASIASEFFSVSFLDVEEGNKDSDVDMLVSMPKKQKDVLDSIVYALRYMHREKLEPEFIRRYRADIVTSPSVRENIYSIMDLDTEWDRIIHARVKVTTTLSVITADMERDLKRVSEDEEVKQLREKLRVAQERYEKSLADETRINDEIGALAETRYRMNNESSEDDLFDEDDGNDDVGIEKNDHKKKESLKSHLITTQNLVQVCKEQVETLSLSLQKVESSQSTGITHQEDLKQLSKKLCLSKLFNPGDYQQYLSTITEYKHVMDLYVYLSTLKEGNEAVRKKFVHNQHESSVVVPSNKRSRRFDRDFYRTCVSEGLRSVCYRFLLPPFRVGIMLESNITNTDGFNWDYTLPGEENHAPNQWSPPVVEDADPAEFASALVDSGELVLLSSSVKTDEAEIDDHPESQVRPEEKDPLRGCRYVAATELAYEPRIRRHLRSIFRSHAVITTRPTAKGFDSIDAFHEYYGIHLLRNKPIKHHFPMEFKEAELLKAKTAEERRNFEEELRSRERESCLQYLNILKAERSGFIHVYIHLPLNENPHTKGDPWYRRGDDFYSKTAQQNLSHLMNELERIYLPPDGDKDEWNEERRKVLRLALTKFLLPQFEAEVRRDLLEVSIRIGIDAAGKKLHSMAMEGPYRPSHMLGENRYLVPTGDLRVVGVCFSTDGKEASYLAAVTERGEHADHIGVPAGSRIDDDSMREKIITFLMQTRPSIIVIGTSAGLPCRFYKRKLSDMVGEAMQRWNNRFHKVQDEDDDEYQERMDRLRKISADCEDKDDVQWKCNVDLVDDNVAQLFGRSVRGKKEFPELATNLKCAIAIARYSKDPLAELTYTWSVASDAGAFGTEILFLNIHPLQQILPKPLLLREFNRVLCNAVADIGVDVNVSCTYDHMHGLLSFVPGFGPRKAASLKQSLIRIGGVVASRRELLAKRLVGPFVYNNAVAFLRIRPIDALSNSLLHPLDDTRLHPDVYHRNTWATKIAIDALELADTTGDSDAEKEDIGITALRDVMKDSQNQVKLLFKLAKEEWSIKYHGEYAPAFIGPAWDPKIHVPPERWRDKVEDLDLETFADMIEQSRMGKWLSHLIMIKWEFRLPFFDPRKPIEPLDKDNQFRLLTGETDYTLRPGKEVTGKVVRNDDHGSVVVLEGDLPGFIPRRNLADGHVEAAEFVVQPGQVVTAIVTEVKKDHLSVYLSLKVEDFRKLPSSWERPQSLPRFDEKFDLASAEAIEKEMNQEREKRLTAMQITTKVKTGVNNGADYEQKVSSGRSGRVTRRACAHPAFRNAKNDEVDKELREGGEASVGEALIRPSSKTADSLALHWQFRRGFIKVIEIIEEDKDSDTSIGNKLKIKNETYGSIDELLARYVAPMNERVEEVLHHRRFMDMMEEDVDHKLRELKKVTPTGVFYFLCWSEDYPGYISLRFVINTVRHHEVAISPEGFLWFRRTYPSIDALLNEFKKNPRGMSSSSSTAGSLSLTSSVGPTKTVAYPPQSSKTTAINNNRPSRWGARSNVPLPPAPSAIPMVSNWGNSTLGGVTMGHAPPPFYPSSRPPPPATLPPMPTHHFPMPAPPGAPPGYPSYQ